MRLCFPRRADLQMRLRGAEEEEEEEEAGGAFPAEHQAETCVCDKLQVSTFFPPKIHEPSRAACVRGNP